MKRNDENRTCSGTSGRLFIGDQEIGKVESWSASYKVPRVSLRRRMFGRLPWRLRRFIVMHGLIRLYGTKNET